MDNHARRRFLGMLAASPLLGYTAAGRRFADESLDPVSETPVRMR